MRNPLSTGQREFNILIEIPSNVQSSQTKDDDNNKVDSSDASVVSTGDNVETIPTDDTGGTGDDVETIPTDDTGGTGDDEETIPSDDSGQITTDGDKRRLQEETSDDKTEETVNDTDDKNDDDTVV